MSFCSDVKNELAAIRPSKSIRIPLLYGFLLFSRSFSYRKIGMQTANAEMAEYYARLLSDVYHVPTEQAQGGDKRITYRVTVPSEADRLKILASFDYGMYDGAINRELLTDAKCAAAFVRGAFFACGNLSDPAEEYRADFSVRDAALAEEFRVLLAEHYIDAHLSRRGTGFVLYLRQSEMIVNLLTLIGASDRSLELIETTILKSVKNNINRTNNCDSGNISKTVEASIAQRTAIEFLERTEKLESLPPELYAAAMLRLNNPDATLRELCKCSTEPITVSGLNHRFARILQFYRELSDKQV